MSDESIASTPEPTVPASSETGSVVPTLDIGSTSGVEAAVAAPVVIEHVVRGRILPDGTAVATGRRKTSVARVRAKRGTGVFTVNGRSLEEFFCVERDRLLVQAPLKVTALLGQYDIWARTNGGGISGQAGAIVLAISRALQALRPELHDQLAEQGFLTRDDRMVERKKYGHKKARRSFQFSKR